MRILSISIENNAALGNFKIDFEGESDGFDAETTILAGDNGVGKSVILKLIYFLSQYSLNNHQSDEVRTYHVKFSDKEVEILNEEHSFSGQQSIGRNYANFVFDFSITQMWTWVKFYYKGLNGEDKYVYGNAFLSKNLRSLRSIVYSTTEINFIPKEIKFITSKSLEDDGPLSSEYDIATEITQLLIDIESIDSTELSHWAKNNVGKAIDPAKISPRIDKFKTAFSLIFPNKQYYGSITENNRKDVLFIENEKKMSISNLSSGEKQIVFRGGFILRNIGRLNGNIVLIDEPEISMHPNWQLKIMDFYKAIINPVDTIADKSQIIVATHSPFILHNNNRYNDKVIILKKDSGGNTIVADTPEFYDWSQKHLVKEAFQFDLTTVFMGDAVKFLFLCEGKTDEKYFRKAIEVFDLKFECDVRWVGKINARGQDEFTGATALNHTLAFFSANGTILNRKTALCYDCDANKKCDKIGENLYVVSLPKFIENTRFKIGIENALMVNDEINDYGDFYTTKEKIDNYGGKTVIEKLDKMKLCNYICDDLSTTQQKDVLIEMKNFLERVDSFISN